MKEKVVKQEIFSFAHRDAIYQKYYNYFYSLFVGHYYVEGLDYQQNEFLFRKLWADGTISATQYVKDVDASKGLMLTAYSAINYNYMDFPVNIRLTKSGYFPIIPSKMFTVDVDAVIGWAQNNHLAPFEYFSFMAKKVADVEVTIRKQLRAHNTPLAWRTTHDNLQRTKTYIGKIDSDADNLIFDYDEEPPEVMNSGIPCIIDKLYNYKNALVNEVLTYIGINNMGASEKKEHLITSEVEVNNDLIRQSGDNFADQIGAFVDRINKLFGYNLKLVVKGQSDIIDEDNTKGGKDGDGGEGGENV